MSNARNKQNRQLLHQKYGGRCAYCGVSIQLETMQADHIVPLRRNDTDGQLETWGVPRGSDDLSNFNPACARCNKWKGTFGVEEFKSHIEASLTRLARDAPNFKLAKDYGLLVVNKVKVQFYFETL
jgi:5-methylcytosine-specific restriction endonuclease McrA